MIKINKYPYIVSALSFAILLTLKLTGNAQGAWLYITMPLWAPASLILILFFIFLVGDCYKVKRNRYNIIHDK